jgi:hypothetical protein
MAAPRSPGRGTSTGLMLVGAAVAAAIAALLIFRADQPAPTGREPVASQRAESRAPPRKPAQDRSERRAGDEVDGAEVQGPQEAPRPERRAPPADRRAGEDPTGDAEVALAAIRRAKADPTESGTAALVASMSSDDPVVVAEAAKALVLRKDTAAIPALTMIDLRTSGGAGLSVIETLGKLGGMADADGKSAAVERLLAMLAEEKQHDDPETPGNLLQIYEALGQTRDARAAGPLENELADPEVGRAPKVVVVQALAQIGEPRSRAALLRARALEVATKLGDAFEAEVQRDLLAAIDTALTKL